MRKRDEPAQPARKAADTAPRDDAAALEDAILSLCAARGSAKTC